MLAAFTTHQQRFNHTQFHCIIEKRRRVQTTFKENQKGVMKFVIILNYTF